jgi:hypothetical protein
MDWRPKGWVFRFVLICAGVIAVLLAVVWAVDGLSGLGLSLHGMIALGLGILLSVGLGVGLMALVFYSNRAGQDDAAGGERRDKR